MLNKEKDNKMETIILKVGSFRLECEKNEENEIVQVKVYLPGYNRDNVPLYKKWIVQDDLRRTVKQSHSFVWDHFICNDRHHMSESIDQIGIFINMLLKLPS